jgi:molecular chaperone DnaJ
MSGADLRHDVTISFEESAFGIEREISLTKRAVCDACKGSGAEAGTGRERCKVCNGSGHVAHSQGFFMIQTTCHKCRGAGEVISRPCHECRGHGHVRKAKKINVKIPPGVEDGMRLILRGEGEAGEHGGPPGDLYVIVSVRRHELFERAGDDVIFKLPVSFPHAALGTKLTVPTLYGNEEVEIPSGIETGEMVRLKGKGFPNVHSKKKGDQIIEVFVKTPKKLSKRQRELLEEFIKS